MKAESTATARRCHAATRRRSRRSTSDVGTVPGHAAERRICRPRHGRAAYGMPDEIPGLRARKIDVRLGEHVRRAGGNVPDPRTTALQGVVIETDPQKNPETGEWGTYLVIRRDHPSGPKIRPFEDGHAFPTRLIAVRHCFDYGAAIIDGNVDGLTVEDL